MSISPGQENAVLNAATAELLKLLTKKKTDSETFFAASIRAAIDEVVDGPRTGRWDIDQLEKVEKTYIGTKLEIILRSKLELPRGSVCDMTLAGVETDIKWSKVHSDWEIPSENVGHLCLGLCLSGKGTFSVGLVVPYADRLRRGENKDSKRQLSAAGRKHIRWLLDRKPMPMNFIAGLPDNARNYIFSASSAQERVRRLALSCSGQFIPRLAFATAAMTVDPARRLRFDSANPKGLDGVRLLGTKVRKEAIKALGVPPPYPADHWFSAPTDAVPD